MDSFRLHLVGQRLMILCFHFPAGFFVIIIILSGMTKHVRYIIT